MSRIRLREGLPVQLACQLIAHGIVKDGDTVVIEQGESVECSCLRWLGATGRAVCGGWRGSAAGAVKQEIRWFSRPPGIEMSNGLMKKPSESMAADEHR